MGLIADPGWTPLSYRPSRSNYSDTHIEIDAHLPHKYQHHHHHRHPEPRTLIPYSPIDQIEREYRARSRSGHSEKTSVFETTLESPPSPRPVFQETVRVDETIVESPKTRTPVKETFRSDEIVEADRSPSPKHHHRHRHHRHHKAKMGHYDEDCE